jgi:hypothetical protein
MQQLAEQQAGRAGADDRDLRAHSGYVLGRSGSELAGYAFPAHILRGVPKLRPECRPPVFGRS